MSKSWIVIDLDGTVCDCSHRVHLAQAKQWDEFHAGIPDDKPREDAVAFIKVIGAYYNLVICTGRDEKHRKTTEKWLADHELDIFFDHILMRPEGNHMPAADMKLFLLDQFFSHRDNALEQVLLILEDTERVVEAFRNAGFKCWQVAVGAY